MLFIAPLAAAIALPRKWPGTGASHWVAGIAAYAITFGYAHFFYADTPAAAASQGAVEELVRFGLALALFRADDRPLRAALPFAFGWASGEAAVGLWLLRDTFFGGGYGFPANLNEVRQLFVFGQWTVLAPAHVALQGITHTALTVWAVAFVRGVREPGWLLALFPAAIALKMAGNAAVLAATTPFGDDVERFAAMAGVVLLQGAIAWAVAVWLDRH